MAQQNSQRVKTLWLFFGKGSASAPRTARLRRAGYSGDMRDGQCFTAARRKALRLAGLTGVCAS